MPRPTPFHPRTQALCTSLAWKEWAGYHAVRSYDATHDREYYAFRHAAGLIDVTPLYKYDLTGPDAAAFLSYLTVRDVARQKPGRVTYVTWCDDAGKVLDDGTITRFDEERLRLTSADPSSAWLRRHARGFDVEVRDRTNEIAAVALQGPNARQALREVCDAELGTLRFFGATEARFEGGFEGVITRTGYTGDLGYEIWVENAHALALWDALVATGPAWGTLPAGLDALDVSRVEAGFILQGVDYRSARGCLIEEQTSTPDELGLGWMVKLDREPFLGQAAIRAERERLPRWRLVGLEIDWEHLEELYANHGLPPSLCSHAWRDAVPVYQSSGAVGSRRQVGRATSGVWSPTLKRNLALATVEGRYQEPGTELAMELTVEYRREAVRARVVETPFFDPPRKKATL